MSFSPDNPSTQQPNNGIVRHAVVEYKCAAFAEIVDIVDIVENEVR